MYKYELKKRFRNFEATRTYFYDTHNEEKEKISDITEEQWKEQIIEEMKKISCNGCKELWFIFHDKDIVESTETEEAKKKGIHAHITILFENGRWPSPLMEELKVNINQINKIKGVASWFRYMTHTTEKAMNEQKYRYEIKELYAFVDGKELSEEEKRERYTEMIVGKERAEVKKEDFLKEVNNKIIKGEIVKSEVRGLFIEKFGEIEGNYNYNKSNKLIKDALWLYKEEYIKMKSDIGRKLVTIYIEGKGNVGKTTLGIQLCQYESKVNGFDKTEVFESSGVAKGLTYDPFQNYDMEYSTLLDEFNPEDTLKFENFHKYFEQNSTVVVSSRQRNKTWLSDFCVISKSRPLEETVFEIYKTASVVEKRKKDNCYKQIQRRIPINIILEEDKIVIKVFNEKENNYKVWKEIKGQARSIKERTDLIKDIHSLVEEIRSTFKDVKELDVDRIK